MVPETKQCPFCANEIKFEAVKCQYCKEWLNKDVSQSYISIQNPDTIIKQALAGRFEILEPLGKGGMATVYKATQNNLNRIVALKIIHQNLIHDQEFMERFSREAQMSASFNHPNIVTIHDVGSVDFVNYISMEYLDGLDMHQLIKSRGRLEYNDVVRWSIGIAEALDYIHSEELLHRDIKSSNIFISHSDRVVLTDFGIASAIKGSNLTHAGEIMGTPEYMSPEQAKGTQIDHRSDLYSLGIVMYEGISGTVPFKGDNPLSTIGKLVNEQAESMRQYNSEVPEWLDALVLKLLSKEPEQRFDSGIQLANALRNNEQEWNSPAGSKTRRISSPKKNQSDLKKDPNGSKGSYTEVHTEDSEQKDNRIGIKQILWSMVAVLIICLSFLGYIQINSNGKTGNKSDSVHNVDSAYIAKIGKRKYRKILRKYDMKAIAGGTFLMGDQFPFAEIDAKNLHHATLNGFYIGEFELTQKQWSEIMGNNPSHFKGKNLPVENVSWKDIQDFISALNKKTGLKFSLPSEAQWEYAARAGIKNNMLFSGGNDLSGVGWYGDNSGRQTNPVGKKQLNALGIYDMSGNVAEWCNDWYGSYPSGNTSNPQGPGMGALKVVRGGSWLSTLNDCRVGRREAYMPDDKNNQIGFRLVLGL